MRVRPFARLAPSRLEIGAARAGDDIVPAADVVMDRAFAVDAPLEALWPWILQLGKRRAGWYLPRRIERLIPRTRRAARTLDPRWLSLDVGDVIPDYGGRDATFTVAGLSAPTTLVYSSLRGQAMISWSITLAPHGPAGTRVHLRLRIGPVRRKWLAKHIGGLVDLLTVAGLAAGLRERMPATRQQPIDPR
jgi:hypothetical protein